MAKSSQSFLAKNMEKVALGVGLGVLVIMLLGQLLGSETTVTLGPSPQVPLQGVNEKLLEQVQIKLQQPVKPTPLPALPSFDKDFEKLSTPELPATIVEPMALGSPRVMITDPTPKRLPPRKFEIGDLAKLIPAPEFTIAVGGPELRQTTPPSDKLAMHVLSTFKCDALSGAWIKELSGYLSYQGVTYVDVQAIMQEMRDDGTWGPETMVKGVIMPDPTSPNQTVELPVVPDWDGTTANWDAKVAPAIQAVQVAEEKLVQPPYWNILNSARQFVPWTVVIPQWMVEYQAACSGQPVSGTTGQPVTPVIPVTPGYPPRPGMPGMPGMPRMPNIPMPHPNRPGQIDPTRPGIGQPPIVNQPVVPVANDLPPQLPAFNNQKLSLMLLWVHDESASYNKVYRYRVRVALLNPLLGQVKLAKTPADAQTARIYSQWSEWSDRVVIPRQAEVFVASSSTGTDASFRVFTRSLGQCVEDRVDAHVGDVVGQKKEKSVVNPLPPNDLVKQTVDFSTGLTVLAIDKSKKIAGNRQPTVQITLMDEQGRIQTRFLQADEDNPRLKKLQEEAKTALPPATIAPPAPKKEPPVTPHQPKATPAPHVGPTTPGPMGPVTPLGPKSTPKVSN